MKYILSAVFLMCIVSCSENKSKIDDPTYEARKQRFVDSAVKAVTQRAVENQKVISEKNSPAQVIKARLSTDEYNSTSVVVTVKNTSNRILDGIKVRWILKNNFGESVEEVYNSGISQDILRPGKTGTWRWNIYSTTATSVSAYVFEAHYKDGETWTSSNY